MSPVGSFMDVGVTQGHRATAMSSRFTKLQRRGLWVLRLDLGSGDEWLSPRKLPADRQCTLQGEPACMGRRGGCRGQAERAGSAWLPYTYHPSPWRQEARPVARPSSDAPPALSPTTRPGSTLYTGPRGVWKGSESSRENLVLVGGQATPGWGGQKASPPGSPGVAASVSGLGKAGCPPTDCISGGQKGSLEQGTG